MNTLRIMLVDDHTLVRKGIKALIHPKPEFSIIAEASDGVEAIQQAQRTKPDIILMDINMPKMDGFEATRKIKALLPDIKIVILTVSDYDNHLFEAIKAGASGYLLKNLEPEELFGMLEKIQLGEAAINGVLAAKILQEFSRQSKIPQAGENVEKLTKRETEVLQRLVQGDDNKEIAESLSITTNTVKTHLTNIMEKLHLRNRLETAIYAVTEGLVDYHHEQ